MKRIAVIGRGTVGCTAVAIILAKSDIQVDWYFDPNINPTPVGEGTTLDVPLEWFKSGLMPLNHDMFELKATVKTGIRKRNWGSNGTDFFHAFPFSRVGVHFSGVTFQDVAFNRLVMSDRVTVHERNVTADDIDNDYVLVCTGSPREITNEFVDANGICVNAALVSQCPWDAATFDYSLTYAMPNGWIFGIPLRERCSIGYVHNSDFADEQQAKKEVSVMLDELGLTQARQNYLKFNNYYRKANFGDRVSYCGNASFFLEPLEATSITSSIQIIHRSLDIWLGGASPHDANDWYVEYFKNIEQMIAMHYAAGSIYDTPFWKYAQSKAGARLDQACQDNELFVNNLIKTNKYKPNTQDPLESAGTWDRVESYVDNCAGLGLEPLLVDLDSKYKLDRTLYDWDLSVWETVA